MALQLCNMPTAVAETMNQHQRKAVMTLLSWGQDFQQCAEQYVFLCAYFSAATAIKEYMLSGPGDDNHRISVYMDVSDFILQRLYIGY